MLEYESTAMALAGMVFVLGILTLIVVLVSQGLKTWRVKTTSMAVLARDQAYRQLAEESVAAQKKMARDLSDLRERVTAMEKMLREVE